MIFVNATAGSFRQQKPNPRLSAKPGLRRARVFLVEPISNAIGGLARFLTMCQVIYRKL